MAVTTLDVELREQGNYSHDLKENDELTILIEITPEKLQWIRRDEQGTLYPSNGFVYKTNVIFGNQIIRLDHLNNNQMLDPSKQLDIPKQKKVNLKFRNNISNTEIRLPKEMADNLAEFMTGGRRKDASCLDFINDLFFGCGTQTLHNINTNTDNNQEIVDLKAGQAILLCDSFKNQQGVLKLDNIHFAILLCDDLYISVFGNDGPICITSLEQLKGIYNTAAHNYVTPISQAVRDQKVKNEHDQIQEPKKLSKMNNGFLPYFSFKNLSIAAAIAVGVVVGIKCYNARNK